jgi:hypothetical protein
MKKYLLLLFFASLVSTETKYNKIYNPLINFQTAAVSSNLKSHFLDEIFDNSSLLNYCGIDRLLDEELIGKELLDVNEWNEAAKKVNIIESYDDAKYDLVRENPDIAYFAARAINFDTREEVLVSNVLVETIPQANCAKVLVHNLCSSVTGSPCFMSNFMSMDSSLVFDEYWTEKQNRLSIIEQNQVSEFVRLETKCMNLGFEGDKNIKICIQREAQVELELEEMKYLMTQNQQPENETTSTDRCFLCDILLGVIKEYPAAKARADRENARRRNAYIKGQNDARASCRSSTIC